MFKVFEILIYVSVCFLAFNLVYDRTFKKQRQVIKALSVLTPRKGVDPAMRHSLNPIERIFMNRWRLKHEIAVIVSDNVLRDLFEKERMVGEVKDYLRTFTNIELFFTKQALIVAEERDAVNDTATLGIISNMIRLRDYHHRAVLIGMNCRKLPRESSIASLQNVAKRLNITDGEVPHVEAQVKAAMYSRSIGYDDGYAGAIAHIIARHPEPEECAGIAQYCKERGAQNFNDADYLEYKAAGVLGDGVL